MWFYDTQLKKGLICKITDRLEMAETLRDYGGFRNPIQTLFNTDSSEMWLATKQ